MDPKPSESLRGLVIGVPAGRRATETAKLIERWGGAPLLGPTVEEVPVTDEGPVVQATQELIDAPATWVVHLTGVGTTRWLDIAQRAGIEQPLLDTLKSAKLVPRGAKANAVLKAHGLEAEWIPAGETSREISDWLSPQIKPGDTVGVQRHGEGVPGLTNSLYEAGAQVIQLATYRWEIPQDRGPAELLVKALIDCTVSALVITSAPQVRNLVLVADALGLRDQLIGALRDHVYLASVGTVASSSLEELLLEPNLTADPPRMGALIRALAGARQDVLGKSTRS